MGKIILTKIFLIGKNPFMLAIYEQHLRNQGYINIVLITQRITCIQYLDLYPGVIFIDSDMFCGREEELLQNIKQKSPDTYIVIISSKSSLEKAEALLEFGVFDIIIKGPYVSTSMHEVLENIRLMKLLVDKLPTYKLPIRRIRY